jgi:hypothetical protein
LRLPGIFEDNFNPRKKVCKGVDSKADHFATPFVYEKRFRVERGRKNTDTQGSAAQSPKDQPPYPFLTTSPFSELQKSMRGV